MSPGFSVIQEKFHSQIFLGGAFLAVIAAAFSLYFSTPASAAEEVNRLGYTSSRICGYCHVDIYKSWKKSIHSRSYTDQAFQDAYRKAYAESKGLLKGYCLRCHAPTTYTTKDVEGSLPITREGVTCDFCHTIEDVNLNHSQHRLNAARKPVGVAG
ncbi:MAG: multiheme c-type cytochrome [Nitrospinota bacterium]